MTGSAYNDDGDPSPLSSPLGPLSASPESGPWISKTTTIGNLSVYTTDDQGWPMRPSADASSSEYDHMARSSLFDDHGLGPSGLDRIRQQPPSRVLTLSNPSTSSLVPPSVQRTPSPRSGSSSRALSTQFSSGQSLPALEDLHRFPSESLHSFSFAQQSDEFLHSRQNILKRSIDFMRDRFGWASSNPGIVNAQARISGDTELQSMVDLLSKANVLDKESQASLSGMSHGPFSGTAEVDGDNMFERAFNEHRLSQDDLKNPSQVYESEHETAGENSRFLSPIPDDQIQCRKREKSAPSSRRVSLKPQAYTVPEAFSPTNTSVFGLGLGGSAVHAHSSKWSPVAQAVFRTEANAPWTILAANDLACLVFGVTQAEVRKLSILEVVQEERRQWLESKLRDPSTDAAARFQNLPDRSRFSPVNPKSMGMGNGVTAQLLSKPPARHKVPRRAQTDDGFGSSTRNAKKLNHSNSKSRGVLLCGDVVPIQKRNGSKGSASLWVMEKRGGLIWVLEEITENIAYVRCDHTGRVVEAHGDMDQIWGKQVVKPGVPIVDLLPCLPRDWVEDPTEAGFTKIAEMKHFAARTSAGNCIPTTVSKADGERRLRISSFPHVAGMMVLSSSTLNVISANSVFSSALFGQERPEGLHITELIPEFENLLHVLTEEDKVALVDGIVIPEHSFRRARALSTLREGKASAASIFLQPTGLPAKHRDGSKILVDVQMRVVKSETIFPDNQESAVEEENESDSDDDSKQPVAVTEVVYALWITYSKQMHSVDPEETPPSDTLKSKTDTATPQQPSSPASGSSAAASTSAEHQTPLSLLSQQLNEAASGSHTEKPTQPVPDVSRTNTNSNNMETPKKKTISDYVIIEEMGQGAYGQVKLARSKQNPSKKVVLKYVTKKKILVDTWTRDRRLGTVPLEIHVLDYLRRDGLRHPNIVEMEGFFEDEINYYIEMVPHGLPGMDLFDYIELRANMDEAECRNIFKQVVDAIHHLHTKALVVHRDIKDENVILDGEGRIKLIDFGSAAYIKNGPFDVFVGTIDYAAPEVLQGKSYRGKEQDVWALGILLYTIVYKENPFYNIDEILDHPLRIPFLPFSEDCIDLIRKMLDRDVDNRLTITEVMEHPWMTET
ncbi:hypothetical protein VTN02DRAFT_3530 [Thermoascus thermophilus]